MKKTISIALLLLAYLFQLAMKYKLFAGPEWATNWLGDLLCLPLMLCFALLTMRGLKRNSLLMLTPAMIVFVWIYVSVVFELILPQCNTKYTADPVDALMYLAGALAFYFTQPILFTSANHHGRTTSPGQNL